MRTACPVSFVLLLALIAAGARPVDAQSPCLLRDIAPGTTNSLPANFVDVFGTTFFTAASAATGHALWKTDGTPAGTTLVKDPYPGTGGGVQPRQLVALDDLLICIADDGVHGGELWRSDGTTAGTTMIKDINPGNQGQPIYMDPPTDLTVFKGRVYFSARDGIHGRELWVSDGTAAGTQMLKDIRPGGNTSDSHPTYFTPVGDTLYFFGYDDVHGWEIWKTDGTAAGTVLVKDVWPGPEPSLITHNSYPFNVGVLGSTLIFAAPDGQHGYELWQTDGTPAGTTLLKDITPGPGDSYFNRNLTAAGPYLYFTADDGVSGQELWRTDSTAAGTTLVTDLNPGPAGSSPGFMMALGGAVVFPADDGVHGAELWRSDGTPGGTRLVKDIWPGLNGSLRLVNIYMTAMVGSRYGYFTADDGVHGGELWRTDGTPAGTTLVQDISAGAAGSYPEMVTLAAGRLVFRASDSQHGQEPRVFFPGATAQVRGTASPVPGAAPRIRATDPVLGQPFTLSGQATAPAEPIALVVGFPGRPLRLPNGCAAYLDVRLPFDLLKEIRPATTTWSAGFFLPALPGLTGLTFGLQAFQLLPASPHGFDATNALVMTLGS
ncbi:MAG: hypothetical protein JXQ29_18730 [Planctomycetes bacterium]|nr:hypothetical protein [Planctomycetota bacterium]